MSEMDARAEMQEVVSALARLRPESDPEHATVLRYLGRLEANIEELEAEVDRLAAAEAAACRTEGCPHAEYRPGYCHDHLLDFLGE